MVEWAFRNPNWWDGIQSWEWVSLNRRCNNRFSSIYETIGSRLIGLYEVTSVSCFPGFGIMITLAFFNSIGQYSSLSIALYSCRRVFCPPGGSFWIIWAVIRSGPGTLVGGNFLITWFKSEAVNGRVLSRYFVWLASMLSTFGLGVWGV